MYYPAHGSIITNQCWVVLCNPDPGSDITTQGLFIAGFLQLRLKVSVKKNVSINSLLFYRPISFHFMQSNIQDPEYKYLESSKFTKAQGGGLKLEVPPLNMMQAPARDPVPLRWKRDNRDWSILLLIFVKLA